MHSRLTQLSRHFGHPCARLVNSAGSAGFMATKGSSPHEKSRRTLRTAACLIIGDEVLGGKTIDTNSAHMAKWCFNIGLSLQRIEVIGDEEDEIIEATRRMSDNYDFVVTSGGIGPTHDDITYASIARAFELPLIEHAGALARMRALSKGHVSQTDFSWDKPSAALEARKRMIRLPIDQTRDEASQVLFVKDDLWVPVSVVNGNIHILPGVPRIFTTMLDHLRPLILPRLADPEGQGTYRITFSTPLAESGVAEYLTTLAAKVKDKGVKVGSYPRWGKKRNAVTLVGQNRSFMESLVPEVELGIQGERVQSESDADTGDEVETDQNRSTRRAEEHKGGTTK